MNQEIKYHDDDLIHNRCTLIAEHIMAESEATEEERRKENNVRADETPSVCALRVSIDTRSLLTYEYYSVTYTARI